MPFKSTAQAKAMFAASDGKSSLGIPKKVADEFIEASKGEPMTPASGASLADEVDAHIARKGKTHRGRRSRGKGAKEHHQDAKDHMAKAQEAKTPEASHAHLFRALSSLNRARKAS